MAGPAPPTLDSLGLLHGTDKSSRTHGYLALYDRLLRPLRLKPVRLLEIGVLGGASLRMWRDYFPAGEIVGLDVDPAAAAHAGERIAVHRADQADVPAMTRLVGTLGPFDIIVDDGSHRWAHQVATLRALLPLVARRGFYIVEDLHTSFGRYAPKYGEPGAETAADFCLRVARRVIADKHLPAEDDTDPFIAQAPALIDSVTIARKVAVFRRK
jgi:predicted O-methyltransferase YrrM